MAEPQLSPEELDRLEDALEDLELGDLIDDPSPAVRTRLADYREILIASRDALPMQEVPAGLLAGVLAEARADADSSEVLGLTPEDTPAEEPESWWSRVRKGFLIPTLAVVGTAALILIIVQPTASDGPTTADMDVVARAEKSDDGKLRNQLETPATPMPDPEPELAAEPAEDAEEEELGTDQPAAAESPPVVEIATARRSKATPSTKADPAPAAVGGKSAELSRELDAKGKGNDKDDAAEEQKQTADWDAIERGDKARMAGDCFTASNHYHRALDDGNDSVRARALAGLGLCASEEGDSAKAGSYFKEARALDPDVGDYIGTQGPDRAQKPKRAAPRKKLKRKSSAYDAPSESLAPNARDVQPFKD